MISVIVPIYNVQKYLPQCLDSIINQTFWDLEIILVDDGSLDGCGKICDEYAQKDKRIKVYHKENGGLSSARNYGIARANGEYLGFVDGDDWIEPDMFKTLVNLIEDKKADLAICRFWYEYPERSSINESVIDKCFDNEKDLLMALIKGSVGNVIWNKLYRKSCFTNIDFPDNHAFEDIATLYKILNRVTIAVICSIPLYHYRMRKGAISKVHSWNYHIDYWLAQKGRYDCLLQRKSFEINREFSDLLLFTCGCAISRTWRWAYGFPVKAKPYYKPYLEEMKAFSSQHLPWFGKKGWPVFLKLSCFMSKFDNPLVFAVLYYMNQVYRIIRRTAL